MPIIICGYEKTSKYPCCQMTIVCTLQTEIDLKHRTCVVDRLCIENRIPMCMMMMMILQQMITIAYLTSFICNSNRAIFETIRDITTAGCCASRTYFGANTWFESCKSRFEEKFDFIRLSADRIERWTNSNCHHQFVVARTANKA